MRETPDVERRTGVEPRLAVKRIRVPRAGTVSRVIVVKAPQVVRCGQIFPGSTKIVALGTPEE
jgi:hypothetical protein